MWCAMIVNAGPGTRGQAAGARTPCRPKPRPCIESRCMQWQETFSSSPGPTPLVRTPNRVYRWATVACTLGRWEWEYRWNKPMSTDETFTQRYRLQERTSSVYISKNPCQASGEFSMSIVCVAIEHVTWSSWRNITELTLLAKNSIRSTSFSFSPWTTILRWYW